MKRKGYLFRRGKKGTWQVQIVVDGETITKSTGTTSKREAKKFRDEFIRPYALGDMRDTLANIKGRLTATETELANAEAERSSPPLSVAHAWEAYERAGNRREIGAMTMKNYVSYWEAFSGWITSKHPKVTAVRDVTFSICEDYWQHLIGQKLTGRTCNAHRAFLRSFWNVLSDKANLSSNPWAKIAKRDEHPQGRRPLTVEELRSVCRTASGELRLLLAFGLYLGCRMGDAACMDWGCLDMVRREIRYIPRKTARKNPDPLLIPMHPELFAILSETPSRKRKGYVCPEMAKRYASRGADGVSDVVQKHFKACGMDTTGERTGAGVRRRVSVGFHSLRHSAVSMLRDAGAAQSISQAIVGHSSAEVHALYSHADAAAMRRAVDTLPAVLSENAVAALPPSETDMPPTPPVLVKIRRLAESMNGKTWKKNRDEILKLAQGEGAKT